MFFSNLTDDRMSASSIEMNLCIDQCKGFLTQIQQLTIDITQSVESFEVDGLEDRLEQRGEVISSLVDHEKRLNEIIVKRKIDPAEMSIKGYVDARQSTFTFVLEKDKILNDNFLNIKSSILSEIKELSRGKKMHKEYVNSTYGNAGFIDIKE